MVWNAILKVWCDKSASLAISIDELADGLLDVYSWLVQLTLFTSTYSSTFPQSSMSSSLLPSQAPRAAYCRHSIQK
jgi:hypothetical protein